MIDLKAIESLTNNDGMTLKAGVPVRYKSGYQVGISGIETTDAREAYNAIKAYNGNCGVWIENGIYYIDYSIRVAGKQAALELGRACNQISIYDWQRGSLIYC